MAKGNFGERLKRERELREVSVDELTKATRISPRFLDALENEEWDKLPGGVFGRGFVRTIARYLGLDEESLLGEYDLARGEQRTDAPSSSENGIPRPPKWIPVLAVLVLVLLLVGLFYGGRYAWRRYAAHRAKLQSSATSVTPSSVAPAASSSPTTPVSVRTSAPLDLSVSTSAATRIRILADNALLLDAELPAGETRHFSAFQQFEVTAGDSSAVLLEFNGQAMPPVETLSPEVLADLRHGRATRERKLAVCSGGAHLEPADRAEVLIVLSADPDEMVSERAQEALLSQPVESFVAALKRDSASHMLFEYVSQNLADKPGIGEAMVQNKNCAAEYLVPIVRHLSTLGIQSLMEELDRVRDSPALASAQIGRAHV